MINKFTMPSFGSTPKSPDNKWIMALSVPSQVEILRCYGCKTRGSGSKNGSLVSAEITDTHQDLTYSKDGVLITLVSPNLDVLYIGFDTIVV